MIRLIRDRLRKTKLSVVLILFATGIILYWSGCLSRNQLSSAGGVLVLDNSDDDFRHAPFEDVVVQFTPKGALVHRAGGLNICQTVGGGRPIAVATDGRFFVVCENVGDKLDAYSLPAGDKLWSLDGDFSAATVAPSGDRVRRVTLTIGVSPKSSF